MAKKQQVFPENCCGACKFSHDVEGQLECFASPPVTLMDEAMEVIYIRSVPVSPEDHICHLFLNRQHA